MQTPDYRNSIVNLMSSILHACGGRSKYKPLSKDLTEEIKKAKNIVLMVVDGLGADSIQKLDKKRFLRKNHKQTISTVFPSTTAAAITTFLTGKAPQEHGLVSWWTHFKEVGNIVAILPFITRRGHTLQTDGKTLKFPTSIFPRLKRQSHFVIKKRVLKSPYNSFLKGKAKVWTYNNMRGFFSSVKKAIKSNTRKKFLYTYWGGFDEFSHIYGKEDRKTKAHLLEFDARLERLATQLRDTNTLILLTADHGQITTSKKKTIIFNQHPLLMECLSMPLCGEPRAAFCYVYPEKVQQFERYVRRRLSKYCTLHKSEDLIKKNFFGLGKAHSRLHDRVGDYILLLKDNYVFRDHLEDEDEPFLKGNHGGLSKEEIMVPLVVVRDK